MSPRTKLTTASGNTPKSMPKVIHGFDRIRIWTDHPEPPSNLDFLKEHHCTDIKPHLLQMRWQARWKCKIEIHQPTTECLRLLAAEFGNHISAIVSYVEIAADFPAESNEQALSWRDSFLSAARMKSQRHLVTNSKKYPNSFYCGFDENEDANRDENKRGKVWIVYADKPSKILNAKPDEGTPPCLHAELRATGTDAVSELGIVTIQDLIDFKHKRFWTEQLTMFELPKPTDLGRLLAKANGTDMGVSGTAFRRRAARWIKNGSIDDIFVMHNALFGRLDIAQKLKIVPFGSWVKKTIR